MSKKLNTKDLVSKLKDVYKSKKKDTEIVSTGADLPMPPFYIKAPDPIAKLMCIPGYPAKRLTEISGKPNSGKTTLGMLAMIEAQKDGCYVILVDTEKKFSKTRFEKMGGDYKDLVVISAGTIEEGFLGLEETLKIIYHEDRDAKTLIVWDSLGGTPANAESEADADEKLQLALAAKVIKRNLRVFVPAWLNRYNIAMIIINTTYQNIGSVGRSNSGGDGLEFASAIIMQLGRVGFLKKQVKGEQVLYGITSRANVTKNHLQDGEITIKELRFNVLAYGVGFEKKKDEK